MTVPDSTPDEEQEQEEITLEVQDGVLGSAAEFSEEEE